MAQEHIQRGTITLDLDDEAFHKAFTHRRRMYADDCEYERPQVAHRMNTLDAVESVCDEDGKGGYCFDRVVFHSPLDILGFFLGYMSGPIMAESQEEREERASRVVMLPESQTASPTGISS
ncbi:MAG TPA: hypothetical protein VHZ51_16510 [Ktedonobacteraceae bacterium]|jgi:hypothetical protein|nr:hypothetical protein [Ktedonobacteraceae bacterium]